MKTLKCDYKERINIDEALNHPFILNYIETENIDDECNEYNPL